MKFKLYTADCQVLLQKMKAESVDALVTDPPAGISFMGKDWDDDKGGRDAWIAWLTEVMRECYRVMKPGAHGLVWALPRTSHWTATALENAGFEIRDVVTHLFGSGFPKSLNVTKSIEGTYECQFLHPAKPVELRSELIPVESNGEKIGSVAVSVATRPEAGPGSLTVTGVVDGLSGPTATLQFESTEPIASNMISSLRRALEDASSETSKSITLTRLEQITGLRICSLFRYRSTLGSTPGAGTALKPAAEFWHLVRKPLSEKTVAANVLKWGTGALNIDGTRIAGVVPKPFGKIHAKRGVTPGAELHDNFVEAPEPSPLGRFPSHLVLDEEAARLLDEQSGMLKSGNLLPGHKRGDGPNVAYGGGGTIQKAYGGDTGGASRFFYVAKASKSDKNAGLEDREEQVVDDGRQTPIDNPYLRGKTGRKNTHPTVKSTKLMRYLVKLITPPNGIVLDPFAGSGSTGVAALAESFRFIGMEQSPEYAEIAKARLEAAVSDETEDAA